MQIDPNSPFFRQRSYSEPLPKELICQECGETYRINQDYFNAKSKIADFCSDECLKILEDKNLQYFKGKAREIIKIYQDRVGNNP